jgi:hypothetical protein
MKNLPTHLFRLSEEERNMYLITYFDIRYARRAISGEYDTEAFKWLMNYVAIIRVSTYGLEWTKKVKMLNKCKNDGKYVCEKCKQVVSKSDAVAHHVRQLPFVLKDLLISLKCDFCDAVLIDTIVNYFPLWDVSNGLLLCVACHNKVHGRRADRGVKRKSTRLKIIGYNER